MMLSGAVSDERPAAYLAGPPAGAERISRPATEMVRTRLTALLDGRVIRPDGTGPRQNNCASAGAVPDWSSICALHDGWAWVRERGVLDDEELDVVLLALAPDLGWPFDRTGLDIPELNAFDPENSWGRPTVASILVALWPESDDRIRAQAHFRPGSPLIDQRMLVVSPPSNVLSTPLAGHVVAVDGQIADILLGLGGLDPRLARFCRLEMSDVAPPTGLGGGFDAELVAAARSHRPGAATRLYLQGPVGSGKHRAVAFFADHLGLPVLTVDVPRLLSMVTDPALLDEFALRVCREASLQGAVLHLDGVDEFLDGDRSDAAATFGRRLAATSQPVVLSGTRPWYPWSPAPLGVVPIELPRPAPQDRWALWHLAFHEEKPEHHPNEDDVDAVARRFRLRPGQIREAGASAIRTARMRVAAGRPGGPPTRDELFAAARAQTGWRLQALARRIHPERRWADLVLPEEESQQLAELCSRVAHRDAVSAWGFGRGSRTGVTALFSGPSGTGKTMAAEVIAAELGLDLFVVDLATVVSKYIGETEKNLDAIFDAAADTDAVLFFDEADALFGKRSAVRDAHDRYANIEVAYLLQRIESHDGITVLASNLRQNVDEAFLRRLDFIVDFPFPEVAERRRLWALAFPAAVPLADDVDLEALAQRYSCTGAVITNAALQSAYSAAAGASPVTQQHLLRALRREFGKAGQLLGPSSVPGAEI